MSVGCSARVLTLATNLIPYTLRRTASRYACSQLSQSDSLNSLFNSESVKSVVFHHTYRFPVVVAVSSSNSSSCRLEIHISRKFLCKNPIHGLPPICSSTSPPPRGVRINANYSPEWGQVAPSSTSF